MRLILASQSPRRRALMEVFSYPFTVETANIDETMDKAASPEREAARVSLQKALAVCRGADDVVVAADTIVVCDGKILGKPKSEREAAEMLAMLSGRAHEVMTGLTVLRGERQETCTEITRVFFRPLSQNEIQRYVRTKEPMDKAGAYAVQGGAGLFVERIEGDYYNVVGLPICRLGQILRGIAPEIMEETK